MIAERDAHLQAGIHARAVFAVEQGCHEPLQVEHEHLTHARILGTVGIQFGCRLAGAGVMCADKLLAVANQAIVQQRLSEGGGARPGEAILEQDFLAVVPRVAAEQLVGALARLAHGESCVLYGLAEQQQGRVHVLSLIHI